MSQISMSQISMSRVLAAVAFVSMGFAALAAPVHAMGTDNPYEDIQVGVTYTVNQPSFTAGLPTPKQASGDGDCPSGTEDNLVVEYGSGIGAQFAVVEGNPMCGDPAGAPAQKVMTFKVQGTTARVFAYCEPGDACTRQDVKKLGGFVRVTLPAAPGLRKVKVLVITRGNTNLSAHQLVKITKSMRPVT